MLDYRNTAKAPKAVLFPQTECMIRFAAPAGPFNEVRSRAPGRHADGRSWASAPATRAVSCCWTASSYRAQYRGPLLSGAAREHPGLQPGLRPSRARPVSAMPSAAAPTIATGSDVFMREAGDAYLVEAVSERGARALSVLGSCPARRPASVAPGTGRRDRGPGARRG